MLLHITLILYCLLSFGFFPILFRTIPMSWLEGYSDHLLHKVWETAPNQSFSIEIEEASVDHPLRRLFISRPSCELVFHSLFFCCWNWFSVLVNVVACDVLVSCFLLLLSCVFSPWTELCRDIQLCYKYGVKTILMLFNHFCCKPRKWSQRLYIYHLIHFTLL